MEPTSISESIRRSPETRDSSTATDDSGVLSNVDLREDREWEDAEDDVEEPSFLSLVDGETFSDIQSMFDHVKATSSLDFLAVCQALGK